jgi:hypothetical protein
MGNRDAARNPVTLLSRRQFVFDTSLWTWCSLLLNFTQARQFLEVAPKLL